MSDLDLSLSPSPKKRPKKTIIHTKTVQPKSVKKNPAKKAKFCDDPVPDQQSLAAAFQKTSRMCYICDTMVFTGTYRNHIDSCKGMVTEDECVVLKVVTREDKIGLPIILDDDDDDTKPAERKSQKKSTQSPIICRRAPERIVRGITATVETTNLVLELNGNNEIESVVENEKYTVLLFNKMLEKVTNGSCHYAVAHSFWREHKKQIIEYNNLRKKEQEVFMTLFLRKRQWLPLNELKNRYSQYHNLPDILSTLTRYKFLDDGADSITLEELTAISGLEVLKKVAKVFKIDHNKSKDELIATLISYTFNQLDIFGSSFGVSDRMKLVFLKELGHCYTINEEIDILFKAIFTLYAPTETNSCALYDEPRKNIESDLMYGLLKQMNQQVSFPAPPDCPTIDIYRDFEELKEYVKAKEQEIAMIRAVYGHNYDKAEEISLKTQKGLAQCDVEYCRTLPPSFRRFTAPTVYVRTLAHMATCYEKQKQYNNAVVLQNFLLNSTNPQGFCCDTRGELWERLAINYECHLQEPETALKSLQKSLIDPKVKDKHKVILQERVTRLTKGRIPPIVIFSKPIEKRITRRVIRKNLGDARKNRWIKNTIDGGLTACSVEETARQYYLDHEDMNYGVHAEGNIWHTIFGLLFWDIIFSRMFDVWFSELQSSPIDLNYPEFYERRKENFEARLDWLKTAEEGDIKLEMDIIWGNNFGITNSEIVWELFNDADECFEFVKCCPREALVGIFDRLIKDYRNTRSGFPDLTLWNSVTKTVAVVEVKGPGDSLSSKQKLWLHHFNALGIRAEVCLVQADRDHSVTVE